MSIIAPPAPELPEPGADTLPHLPSAQVNGLIAVVRECLMWQQAMALHQGEFGYAERRLASALDLLRILAQRVPATTEEQRVRIITSALAAIEESDASRLLLWRALVPNDKEFANGKHWGGH